jgi:hypothetical protein
MSTDLEYTHQASCPRCGRTVAAGTEHRCADNVRVMGEGDKAVEFRRRDAWAWEAHRGPLGVVLTKGKAGYWWRSYGPNHWHLLWPGHYPTLDDAMHAAWKWLVETEPLGKGGVRR